MGGWVGEARFFTVSGVEEVEEVGVRVGVIFLGGGKGREGEVSLRDMESY